MDGTMSDACTGARAADPFLPALYRVAAVHRELGDTVTLDLVPGPGATRPDFAPGQFNMLYAFGVGEVPISVSGPPDRGSAFRHTVRSVGAVSAALTKLAPGAAIGLRGPYGRGWPVEAAEGGDVVLIAGGLGLAPLRPALYAILGRRARYGRVALLCGSRTPSDQLFRDELERWSEQADLQVLRTVDHADASWHGYVGVVPGLVARAGFDPANTTAMVCGPEIMMRFSAAALVQAGVAASRIHLSLERNMHCAIGLCGHCQFGPDFVCKDGPVTTYERVAQALVVREL